jgi:hypothetical protein
LAHVHVCSMSEVYQGQKAGHKKRTQSAVSYSGTKTEMRPTLAISLPNIPELLQAEYDCSTPKARPNKHQDKGKVDILLNKHQDKGKVDIFLNKHQDKGKVDILLHVFTDPLVTLSCIRTV